MCESLDFEECVRALGYFRLITELTGLMWKPFITKHEEIKAAFTVTTYD